MIFFKKIIILSVLTISSTFSQAEVESWYTFWSMGFASHTYPAEVQEVFNDKPAYVTRIQVATDVLGFYWPFPDERTILGFVVNSSGDALSDGYNTVQFTQTSVAISAMRFFGSEPGDGFFVRGDVGSTSLSISQDGYSVATTESGLGLLAGIGYGIKMSEGTRILLSTSFARNAIPTETGETFNSLRFTIGGLW
ncbi:MAG: hypothetical protein HRU38_22990 [Saccharospirillaceae bacterium]|nr:hypothetical protein [Pseudomonadales bacterium]NRB81490.1 hypothetical protein [Saccharospirillaceae bacterium]